MARYYGSVQGRAKTLGHRIGSKNLIVKCNGWKAGIKVVAYPDSKYPEFDFFEIYQTDGSTDARWPKLIGTLVYDPDKKDYSWEPVIHN